ncbi:hypothetical protein BWQ96_03686 [Gracilariopsis chorda]|uniref:Uncharacterized protein n=1 Tax=Gracilariopsis chorda TaxID=448386 RepID=A0A2V3IWN6_9FLOR|nr:hypothetical protein BWQ96_03686 [Gracilariopsis chorda]|eukprot:PXF46558.1 hypothetical protein BWQ96_03686 [Gracilariopsis chorda]
MEAVNSAKKPAHGQGETRKKNLSSKTLVRPISAFKSKLRAFVRKLSGKSKKEKVYCNSPNVEPASSGTLVTVPDEDLEDVDGICAPDRDVFASKGAVNTTSLSPLLGEERFTTTSLQEAKASTQVIECEGDDLTTVASTTDFGERADDVPHRVKSKLPSEETLPFIEPGSSSLGCGTSDLSHTSEALEIYTSGRVALLLLPDEPGTLHLSRVTFLSARCSKDDTPEAQEAATTQLFHELPKGRFDAWCDGSVGMPETPGQNAKRAAVEWDEGWYCGTVCYSEDDGSTHKCVAEYHETLGASFWIDYDDGFQIAYSYDAQIGKGIDMDKQALRIKLLVPHFVAFEAYEI